MKKFKVADCDVVCVYDPARSRETEYGRQARNAIGTFAATPEYDVVVLTYWAGRGNLRLHYEEVKRQVELFRPRCIGVEDVAIQLNIGEAFNELSRVEGTRLPPIEPVRPDTRVNKKFRIKTSLQRVAPYGKFFYQRNMYELRSEWLGFPNGRTIDILDITAYAIQLLNIPTTLGATYNERLKERIIQTMYPASISYDQYDNVIDLERYRLPGPPSDVATVLRYG